MNVWLRSSTERRQTLDKSYYRPSLRLDLNDPEQKRIADWLKKLLIYKKGSINTFIIQALKNEIKREGGNFDFSLEDVEDTIRTVMREELQHLSFRSTEADNAPLPFTPDEVSEEEVESGILDALDLFGC